MVDTNTTAVDLGGPCTPPPVPVKTSHKRDGRHRWPLIFHVSCLPPPPPSDHPGSDAVPLQNHLKTLPDNYSLLLSL